MPRISRKAMIMMGYTKPKIKAPRHHKVTLELMRDIKKYKGDNPKATHRAMAKLFFMSHTVIGRVLSGKLTEKWAPK